MSETAAAGMPVVALVMSPQDLEDMINATVERCVAELAVRPTAPVGWLDTRRAAEYAGITPKALNKLTGTRALRFEQDCPGGKCWFKAESIDAWREGRT